MMTPDQMLINDGEGGGHTQKHTAQQPESKIGTFSSFSDHKILTQTTDQAPFERFF